LGYPDAGESEPSGWRCFTVGRSSGKEVVEPITIEGGSCGQTADLIPTFEILHRIYRETLAPRVGNWDQIHGYVFDLLKLSHEKQHTDEKMDVMDFIYNEMWTAMIDRRSPVYGPYIMMLICDRWSKANNGENIMEDGSPVTKHQFKRLNKKKPKKIEVGPSAPSKEPSWFKKFQVKLKKSFCLKLDLQHRMYEAHVYHKKAAARQKDMMRKMQIPVSPTTSADGQITPKEEWISKHSVWSDEETVDLEPEHEDPQRTPVHE